MDVNFKHLSTKVEQIFFPHLQEFCGSISINTKRPNYLSHSQVMELISNENLGLKCYKEHDEIFLLGGYNSYKLVYIDSKHMNEDFTKLKETFKNVKLFRSFKNPFLYRHPTEVIFESTPLGKLPTQQQKQFFQLFGELAEEQPMMRYGRSSKSKLKTTVYSIKYKTINQTLPLLVKKRCAKLSSALKINFQFTDSSTCSNCNIKGHRQASCPFPPQPLKPKESKEEGVGSPNPVLVIATPPNTKNQQDKEDNYLVSPPCPSDHEHNLPQTAAPHPSLEKSNNPMPQFSPRMESPLKTKEKPSSQVTNRKNSRRWKKANNRKKKKKRNRKRKKRSNGHESSVTPPQTSKHKTFSHKSVTNNNKNHNRKEETKDRDDSSNHVTQSNGTPKHGVEIEPHCIFPCSDDIQIPQELLIQPNSYVQDYLYHLLRNGELPGFEDYSIPDN